MTTSFVLALTGALLILVGLIGGGFSFSGSMMPVVGKVVRIPCFIVGVILIAYAIALALYENNAVNNNGSTQGPAGSVALQPKQGVVQFGGGGIAYIYQFPSLAASPVGALRDGTIISILCTTQGDTVTRIDGVSSSLWDRIDQGYMPDVNVFTNTNQAIMPNCGS
jgi:hypothetical protein